MTVVLPCRDEAGSLPGVLRRIPAGYQIVVVDNNSTDGTATVARSYGARVVHQPVPGYGSAVHAGVEAATTPLVGVLDADGSMDPAQLPALVDAVLAGADLAVGRRRPVGRAGWPWHARVANRVIAGRLRRRHGLHVHDIAAMRVSRTRDLLDLNVTDRRSGYPLQVLVLAARAGWNVVEFDIDYRPRTAGVSKVSGSVRGTVLAAYDFWKTLG